MIVLPFTAEQFFAVFAAYNLAIWPAQILAYLLGAVTLALALCGGPLARRVVPATLAAMWIWTGLGYHLLFFAKINPAARLFGAAFLVQGALFAWAALQGGVLGFAAPRNRLRLAFGVFLAVYAAVLYPILGYLAGHVWPSVPSFGVAPCPVVIFTFGLLLIVRDPVPLWLLAIPALWTLIGGQAAFLLSVPQDWMLLLGGVAATAVLIRTAWTTRTMPSRIRPDAAAGRGAFRDDAGLGASGAVTQAAPLAAWLRRRPMRGYIVLAFGVSWGGILLILTATGFDLAPMGPWTTGGVAALMLLGPSLAGLVMTVLVDGRAGLRAMLARLRTWRFGLIWYAVALLTAPLLLLGILGGFGALADPAFAPRFQWWLFAAGLTAGLFEEIGWTGFATPRLLARHHLGRAGLWLGGVWALWHLLVDFRYNAGTMGGAWLLEFAIVYLATLTPYRILMMWVYARTQSLLLAMLMHASFTGWLLVLYPGTSFAQGLLWQAVFAAMLWLMVALVLTRDPAQPRGSDTR